MFQPLPFVPSALQIEWDGLEAYCSVPIASCIDTQRIIFVKTSLSSLLDANFVSDYTGIHEFSFEIEVVSLDGSAESYATQDRTIVRNCLGVAAPALILPVVEQGLNALVAHVEPSFVYLVTKMRLPTPKAIAKHDLVCIWLDVLGYDIVVRGTDAWQRIYWILERRLLGL